MRIEDLDTPVPVIDLDRVEHNLTQIRRLILRVPPLPRTVCASMG
jgi:D-serine deaminase-like pyridoxal phosphate-dependent protein